MNTQNCIRFELNVPAGPAQAYIAIGKPQEWWHRALDGEASAVGGCFVVNFTENDFVRFTVTEAQPGRRIVWHVDDCFLHWFQDKTEWTGTDVIFDIRPTEEGSTIQMVHRGLTPEVECYDMCLAGWEGHVMKGLRELITAGNGIPKGERHATVQLGNHSAVVVASSEQHRIRSFYRDVLGCTTNVESDQVDRLQLGDLHICFVYQDAALDAGRFQQSIWLELKTDRPEEMREKILAFGVKRLDLPDRHLYFQAPGGQVFRLVGVDEDLSAYEQSTSSRPRSLESVA